MSLYKVYILQIGILRRSLKEQRFGISLNPHNRIQTLNLDKIVYRGFDDLYVYGIYETHNPRDLEAAAHIYFKKYRCNLKGFEGCTEFFDIHPLLAERFLLNTGAKKIYDPNTNLEEDV